MSVYLDILKKYWNYDAFRGIQEDIIESIGKGKDTLGLMPTGGGKSITFQVPTLAMEGMCLVITPLIALMKDQVANLKQRGIKASALYSGMTKSEISITLDNCIFGGSKFLYVSPERVKTELFQAKIAKMNIALIAVDESHCISQWGYDFRPAYLEIAQIRKLLPKVPILALTATATPDVVADIQEKLLFKESNIFKMSFKRDNLAYIIHQTDDKEGMLLNLMNRLQGSTIVYVRSRKRCKDIASFLEKNGHTATFYHAGLNHEIKDKRQQAWQNNQFRVIVATNAFGMGIDKPDVRLVVHMDLPDSIEAYFQEAGRAGRDLKNARAILFCATSDATKLKKRISDNFPEKDYILKVYEHLQYFYQMAMGDGKGCIYDFNLEEFCLKFKHFPVQCHNALSILTQAGVIEYTEEQDNGSRILFKIRRDELYLLKSIGEDAENLINTLLRSYTGLFTEYAYINEELLATRTGLSRQQIYDLLVLLTKRNIVNYIPRKKTPYIIYTQERLEEKRVPIPKRVYEDRKKNFSERIQSMIDYTTQSSVCRSRILLKYFGENSEEDCGHCDVCLNKKKNTLKNSDNVIDRLKQILSKEKGVTITQLKDQLLIAEDELIKVIRPLIDEEYLIFKDGLLFLP